MNSAPDVSLFFLKQWTRVVGIELKYRIMLTLRCSEVPFYLRESSFYGNLCADDSEMFAVLENCLKPDLDIYSYNDLLCLLRTVQFWGLPEIPIEVICYIISVGDVADYIDLLDKFPDMEPFLSKILQVKSVGYLDLVSTAIDLGLGVRIVRLLHSLDYILTSDDCEKAAAVGDVESLQYLHKNKCPWDARTTTAAVLHNHCACLRYALDLNCARTHDLMSIAAEQGDIESIKCLRTFGLLWLEDTVLAAIRGHNMNNLQYLVENGCPVPENVCTLAVIHGDVSCLAYLHRNGHPVTPIVSIFAALGHLTHLQYLNRQGFILDPRHCSRAAMGNHLDCLQYLHENGCPWDESTITAAIVFRSWSCLWYAFNNGCPMRCIEHLGACVIGMLAFLIVAFVNARNSTDWLNSIVCVLTWLSTVSVYFLHVFHAAFGGYYVHYISPDMARRTITRFGYVVVFFWVVYLAQMGLEHLA